MTRNTLILAHVSAIKKLYTGVKYSTIASYSFILFNINN